MNRKKFKIILLTLIFVEIISIFLTFQSFFNTKVYNSITKNEINDKLMAIYVDDGTGGGYKEYKDGYPEGYELNLEATECLDINGNKVEDVISYDNGEISVNIKKTVFCNLYFDISYTFAVYSDDNSLRFYKDKNIPIEGGDYKENYVVKVFTDFEKDVYSSYEDVPWHEYANDIAKVEFVNEIRPKSTAYWFYGFQNITNFNIEKLNTKNVIDMSYMFYKFAYNTAPFDLEISNWDTSKVEDMSYMFYELWHEDKTTSYELDLSNWNTSSVTNMSYMFYGVRFRLGQDTNASFNGDFELNISTWDTSKVTNMSYMFYFFEYRNPLKVTLDLSTHEVTKDDKTKYIAWNTANVENMEGMFGNMGYTAKEVVLNLSNWKVSHVTNMSKLFYKIAKNATSYATIDFSNWDTSQVTDMSYMFEEAGYNAKDWNGDGLTYLNTSSVTNMSRMFFNAGYSAENFALNLLNWNVSKVTDMSEMFGNSGYNSPNFKLDLSNWNTSQVTNMYRIFYKAGGNADYYLELSKHTVTNKDGTTYTAWDVSNVDNYSEYNAYVEDKITIA